MVKSKTTPRNRFEIELIGSVPSKKNSRINTSSGRSFPSKDFTKWQENAIKELRIARAPRFFKPVRIELIIFFGTLAKADLDNRLTSILDMLVEALIIPDDKWLNVPSIELEAQHRARKPGAFIRIEELPEG